MSMSRTSQYERPRRAQLHHRGLLAKMLHTPFNHERTSDNSKIKDFLQNKRPALFKCIKVIKNKAKRRCHILEETKETEYLNTMWAPGLDPGPEKGHGGEPQSL